MSVNSIIHDCGLKFQFPDNANKNVSKKCKDDGIHGICERCSICVQCGCVERNITLVDSSAQIYHSVLTELSRNDDEITDQTPLTRGNSSKKCCGRFRKLTPFQKTCGVISVIVTIAVGVTISIIVANS